MLMSVEAVYGFQVAPYLLGKSSTQRDNGIIVINNWILFNDFHDE